MHRYAMPVNSIHVVACTIVNGTRNHGLLMNAIQIATGPATNVPPM